MQIFSTFLCQPCIQVFCRSRLALSTTLTIMCAKKRNFLRYFFSTFSDHQIMFYFSASFNGKKRQIGYAILRIRTERESSMESSTYFWFKNPTRNSTRQQNSLLPRAFHLTPRPVKSDLRNKKFLRKVLRICK